MASNVLGTELECCCMDPLTGYYRNGKCDTGPGDHGLHTVCILASDEFLEFSRAVGNDLSTAVPEMHFPGVKGGDKWCLCVNRWVEAYNAGKAPKLNLEATHISALEFIPLETMKAFSE